MSIEFGKQRDLRDLGRERRVLVRGLVE